MRTILATFAAICGLTLAAPAAASARPVPHRHAAYHHVWTQATVYKWPVQWCTAACRRQLELLGP